MHTWVDSLHEDAQEEMRKADVFIGFNLPREWFVQAKKLKLIIFAVDGVGPKRLYDEIRQSNVFVSNSKGCRSQAIAEHAFALMLACTRRLFDMTKTLTPEGWWGNGVIGNGPLPTELFGRTIGILGLGHIGARIAKIAKQGFDMKVLGARRSKAKTDNVDQVYGPDGLNEILNKSDFIALALPETEQTTGLFGKKEFAVMKPGMILVNIARGSLIDTGALIEAIENGTIVMAGLDVFDEEPLPEKSPLRGMPQVIATPHAAGVTPFFWPRFSQLIKENIRRLEAGLPIINLTDKLSGY